MIIPEKLNGLHESILMNPKLAIETLKEYDFHSKDLLNLVDDLFCYGQKLFSMNEYDKANKYFETCYELNPDHLGSCFQLFLKSIQNRDYTEAFKFFNVFYMSRNKYNSHDNDYYLYLLSMITELPEVYREHARYLKLEDIKSDKKDKKYTVNQIYDRIRLSSSNQKFVLALKQLDNVIEQKKGKLTVQDIVIKTLLEQAKEKQIETKKHLEQLIKKREYEKAIQYLQCVEKRHSLTFGEDCILSLMKDLVSITETGIIPKGEEMISPNLFQAIRCKNYEFALSLIIEERIRGNNIKLRTNMMYILLTEIKKLIYRNQQCKCSVTQILAYLMKNDLDNAFLTLRKGLTNIGKRDYEFLIIDFIKISFLEGDVTFTKPMSVLNDIVRGDFEFDLSEYILNFYETLAQNKIDQAGVYLDILSKAKKLGQQCILIEGLKAILKSTEMAIHYKRNSSALDNVDQSVDNIETKSMLNKH